METPDNATLVFPSDRILAIYVAGFAGNATSPPDRPPFFRASVFGPFRERPHD